MGFLSKIASAFSRQPEIDWEDLEAMLIQGDLGVRFTNDLLARLKASGAGLRANEIMEACREEILNVLPRGPLPLRRPAGAPGIILVTGVNGTGKTTSVAKLARFLKVRGESVMAVAADTFRAAAIEQLEVWAQRIEIPLVKGPYKADPAAVCFEAYERASASGVDFLLCDTAGRLHTRHNLMEELAKIRRVFARKDPAAPHETLLVVDATTGSNALTQAREFHRALGGLSGLIVTKLDGSGRGGVIVSIQKELDIPARFIGTGEKAEDFAPFDAHHFVEEIL
ncbi:MAG: signal recognition particle-docking protein FtsY [Verrucomicrobiales bacterium]